MVQCVYQMLEPKSSMKPDHRPYDPDISSTPLLSFTEAENVRYLPSIFHRSRIWLVVVSKWSKISEI